MCLKHVKLVQQRMLGAQHSVPGLVETDAGERHAG
jgi:hypothetical protein